MLQSRGQEGDRHAAAEQRDRLRRSDAGMPELRSERNSESVQKRQRDLSILPVVWSEAKGGRG